MGVKTTTTTSNDINYEELKNSAYDFLKKFSNGRLPIDLLHIIHQIDNLRLMKYTNFAKMHNLTLEEIYDILQSEDGALWYQTSTNSYILLYNDLVENKERIRFTIAHELGHYALRHNELTDKTTLSRYSLSSEEYDRFEKEANFFAKHLLVPFPILGNYVQFFHKMDTDFIHTVFNVSYSVANYVIKNLQTMQSFGLVKEGHVVEEKFADYITTTQSTRICKSCHSKINRRSNYCHICSTKQYEGLTTLEAYLENREKEKKRMRYTKYELDNSGYPKKCPRCDNEELENSNYCNICGIYTLNVCVGDYNNNFDAWGNPIPISQYLDNGCKKILNGNSRYCPDCGGKSSYFFQGLLKNWDIEKKENNQ
ncbi:ImmA/IrrE family metallo-endopeptidase [Streptococcus pasteurianus]